MWASHNRVSIKCEMLRTKHQSHHLNLACAQVERQVLTLCRCSKIQERCTGIQNTAFWTGTCAAEQIPVFAPAPLPPPATSGMIVSAMKSTMTVKCTLLDVDSIHALLYGFTQKFTKFPRGDPNLNKDHNADKTRYLSHPTSKISIHVAPHQYSTAALHLLNDSKC